MDPNNGNRPDKPDFEATYYRYRRDLNGNLVAVDVATRNGRRVPYFPPAVTEPPVGNSDDAARMSRYRATVKKVTENLTRIEQRTFLRIHQHGWSVDAIAKKDGVSRQAIYSQIKAMIQKNFYCKISAQVGRLRKKTNQHE